MTPVVGNFKYGAVGPPYHPRHFMLRAKSLSHNSLSHLSLKQARRGDFKQPDVYLFFFLFFFVLFFYLSASTNQSQDRALSGDLGQCGDWPPGGNALYVILLVVPIAFVLFGRPP